jgi:hypothetical protein
MIDPAVLSVKPWYEVSLGPFPSESTAVIVLSTVKMLIVHVGESR